MLFDKEFEFEGKHATYCRALKEEIGLFTTFREAYMISAIVGFLYGSKAIKDSIEKVQPASILPSELAKQRSNLRNIYRYIMLLEETPGFSIEDYKSRTFKDDSEDEDPEKIKKNMEIFNSYVLGGIEILYDKFKDCGSKKDVVNSLNDFLEEFVSDNEIKVE